MKDRLEWWGMTTSYICQVSDEDKHYSSRMAKSKLIQETVEAELTEVCN